VIRACAACSACAACCPCPKAVKWHGFNCAVLSEPTDQSPTAPDAQRQAHRSHTCGAAPQSRIARGLGAADPIRALPCGRCWLKAVAACPRRNELGKSRKPLSRPGNASARRQRGTRYGGSLVGTPTMPTCLFRRSSPRLRACRPPGHVTAATGTGCTCRRTATVQQPQTAARA
jgi:hypothetical protein